MTLTDATTAKKWEILRWRKKNKKCAKCAGECKQSSFVELVSCPQFKKAGA